MAESALFNDWPLRAGLLTLLTLVGCSAASERPPDSLFGLSGGPSAAPVLYEGYGPLPWTNHEEGLWIGGPAGALSAVAPHDGKELVRAWRDRYGFQNQAARLRIRRTGEGGGDREWTLLYLARPSEPGERRFLIRFLEPGPLHGRALLSLERADRVDRWRFTPDEGQIRRVSSDHLLPEIQETGFHPDDLSLEDLHRHRYRLARPSSAGTPYHVVVATPRSDSRYRRRRLWFEPETLRRVRADWYDADGLARSVFYGRWRKVEGVLHPTHLRIRDHRTGLTSDVLLEKWRIDRDLPDDLFTPRQLRRFR